MSSAYGWIITKDHLSDDSEDISSEVGIMGPRNISPAFEEMLRAGKGKTFRMYDDDGELYYTGRAILPADDAETNWERCLAGPLDDFGTPNAGAVVIKWHGHPEWTIG